MKRRWLLAAATSAAYEMLLEAQPQDPKRLFAELSYSAAVYFPALRSEGALTVYPYSRKAVVVPMPFFMGTATANPLGTAIYALGYPPKYRSGIYRIEFDPPRATFIPGSDGLFTKGMAVSGDGKYIYAYGNYGDRPPRRGRLFELSTESGRVKLVSLTDEFAVARRKISVSPDRSLVLASYDEEIHLIDLRTGASKPILPGIVDAAWSPDGRWIAGVESASTVKLLSGIDFTPVRTIGATDLNWSPDSKFLLTYRLHFWCGPYGGSLEAIEVKTGRHFVIKSSICRIVGGMPFWIDNRVIGNE